MKIMILSVWAAYGLEFGVQIKTDKPKLRHSLVRVLAFLNLAYTSMFFQLELTWFLKPALLPSICSGFRGFDRALDLTIVCLTSQVICT